MTPILECIGIGKHFDGVVAANAIDFVVRPREIIGIIGANGAGKTTLFNIISGYLQPTVGSVRFKGDTITGLTPRQIKRRGVGRSFQIPQTFDGSTARENLMIAHALTSYSALHWLRAFRSERAEHASVPLMESLGLARFIDEPASNLPHGARKLLDIALALAAQPELLLLDEPTSGVSATEKTSVMKALWENLGARGTTVVFIEHDMELVGTYASRVVALYDGAVIADGVPQAVLSDPNVVRYITGTRQLRVGPHA